MPTFNQLSKKGSSDICKEVHSSRSAEIFQLSEEEILRRKLPAEAWCLHSCQDCNPQEA